jgi:hypothetical protein
MRGDYCPVPDTPNLCKHEERIEEPLVLTPKGCLAAAFINVGIEMREGELNSIWKEFAELMKKNGYVQNDDESHDDVDNKKKFVPGQIVTYDEIVASEEWEIDDVYEGPDYVYPTYVTTDGTLSVTFSRPNETATIIMLNKKDRNCGFSVGQRVHIGEIGASSFWYYVSEINDTIRYVSKNNTMTVVFVKGDNWGTIMLNQ